MGTHHRATERHLSYGIAHAQYYLRPDAGERVPPKPQPCRPILDLPTPEGCLRLSWPWWLVIYRDAWLTCP